MNDCNLDDDLLRDYLAESNEHLATIENDLLAMEQAGASVEVELVNRVFRAAHSIKGGAGFFDLVKIRELAHKIENLLDLIRSRQMTPSPEIVSLLLLAFDRLRTLLQNHRESNGADVEEFVEALTRLAADHLSGDQKTSMREQVELVTPQNARRIQISAFDLSQARRGAKCIFLIHYDLIHDVQRQGRNPLEVFKSLAEYGDILEMALDLDSAGTLDDEPSNGLMLEVLFATVLGPELIGRVVEVPPERVWLIERNGVETPLATSPPAPEPEPKPSAPARAATPPPPAPALPATIPADAARPAAAAPATPAENTIRLSVSLLDSLMTLAGELVLSRNQLNESLARKNERGIRTSAQRVNLVTSELQEVVSLTRMQSVGSLFARFPRLVRDLGRDLGKEAQLRIEGGDVEIDKTILEGLSDPLTHMVRNAVDHGIEPPADRRAAGKPATGTVRLSASHQGGQVVIEIADDGKGLAVEKVVASSLAKGVVTQEQVQTMSDRDKMALIFLPGVSTARTVSDVSGRGVGMDVVKTNLDKLGGKIEIDSEPGRGSRFRIKLPLTLAIIPSLLVSDGGERFAIPQVSVSELIRIPARQIAGRIDRVGDARVLTVRDRLLPLIRLADALGTARAEDPSRALNVVLVNTGTFEYGLAVEELHDTVEIVVKPLGRHFKKLPEYAGATILGDGRVAVILDVAGLAACAGLSARVAAAASRHSGEDAGPAGEAQALLLFHNAPGETCAVPIELVARIERIRPPQVQFLGGRRTMQYRGASLPLVALRDSASVGELSEDQAWIVIVFEKLGRPLGLLAAEPLDMLEASVELDTTTHRQPGIAGSSVIENRTILMLDAFELAGVVHPQDPAPLALPEGSPAAGRRPLVVLAEDSDFFRAQIRRLIEAVGADVLPAEDGEAAWELLDRHEGEVSVLATDVEMPRLDGLSLTRRIRSDPRFTQLPVIALSALAGEEEIARGRAAGVDDYQIKLDKDQFTEGIRAAIARAGAQTAAAGKENGR